MKNVNLRSIGILRKSQAKKNELEDKDPNNIQEVYSTNLGFKCQM